VETVLTTGRNRRIEPPDQLCFGAVWRDGYRINPVRRDGVMPGGNECIFPFRRV